MPKEQHERIPPEPHLHPDQGVAPGADSGDDPWESITPDMTVIYALTEPDTGVVRYVGQSTDPKRRYRGHVFDSRSGETDHKSNWIASLLRRDVVPGLLILEVVAREEANAAEGRWISHYRELVDLTNHRDEGDVRVFDDATRHKISASKAGCIPWNRGGETPEYMRQRQREIALRRVKTPAGRAGLERMWAGMHAKARMFSDAQVRDIRERHARGESANAIGRLYGVNHSSILCIARGESYKNVK